MERLEKINNDFATLFREGQRLLQEGCGDVMNRHREEAVQRFEDLGGIHGGLSLRGYLTGI